MDIVARIGGSNPGLADLFRALPPERLLAVWRPGDRIGRNARETFGANILLADDDAPTDAMSRAEAAVEQLDLELRRAAELGASIEVDIGMYVASQQPSSVRLSGSWFTKLMSIGATVVVTAYPCSEE